MRLDMLLLLGTVLISIQSHAQDSRNHGTIKEWAKTLDQYAGDAISSEEGTKADSAMIHYFRAFPSDFNTFKRLFGYQRDDNDYIVEEPPVTHTLSGFLPKLKAVVPAKEYYEKMLSVGIGGVWDADEVNYLRQHIREIVVENVKLSLSVLSKKEEKEIKSIWRFLYDGPHPEHPFNRIHFEKLYSEVMDLNPKAAEQFKSAYERLLSEVDSHGH